jgi:hypothetical protein
MLNFVVAPFGQIPGAYPSPIAYSYGGDNRRQLRPRDPQHYHTGESGLYYDTPLGAIPTDEELSYNYGYTPVTSGWVAAKEGYFPSPWNPPNGWNPAGAYGPRMSLNGLGADVIIPASATPSEAQSVVDALNEQNKRVFKVTVISSVIVGFAALLNSYRMIKQIRREEALLSKAVRKR